MKYPKYKFNSMKDISHPELEGSLFSLGKGHLRPGGVKEGARSHKANRRLTQNVVGTLPLLKVQVRGCLGVYNKLF